MAIPSTVPLPSDSNMTVRDSDNTRPRKGAAPAVAASSASASASASSRTPSVPPHAPSSSSFNIRDFVVDDEAYLLKYVHQDALVRAQVDALRALDEAVLAQALRESERTALDERRKRKQDGQEAETPQQEGILLLSTTMDEGVTSENDGASLVHTTQSRAEELTVSQLTRLTSSSAPNPTSPLDPSFQAEDTPSTTSAITSSSPNHRYTYTSTTTATERRSADEPITRSRTRELKSTSVQGASFDTSDMVASSSSPSGSTLTSTLATYTSASALAARRASSHPRSHINNHTQPSSSSSYLHSRTQTSSKPTPMPIMIPAEEFFKRSTSPVHFRHGSSSYSSSSSSSSSSSASTSTSTSARTSPPDSPLTSQPHALSYSYSQFQDQKTQDLLRAYEDAKYAQRTVTTSASSAAAAKARNVASQTSQKAQAIPSPPSSSAAASFPSTSTSFTSSTSSSSGSKTLKPPMSTSAPTTIVFSASKAAAAAERKGKGKEKERESKPLPSPPISTSTSASSAASSSTSRAAAQYNSGNSQPLLSSASAAAVATKGTASGKSPAAAAAAEEIPLLSSTSRAVGAVVAAVPEQDAGRTAEVVHVDGRPVVVPALTVSRPEEEQEETKTKNKILDRENENVDHQDKNDINEHFAFERLREMYINSINCSKCGKKLLSTEGNTIVSKLIFHNSLDLSSFPSSSLLRNTCAGCKTSYCRGCSKPVTEKDTGCQTGRCMHIACAMGVFEILAAFDEELSTAMEIPRASKPRDKSVTTGGHALGIMRREREEYIQNMILRPTIQMKKVEASLVRTLKSLTALFQSSAFGGTGLGCEDGEGFVSVNMDLEVEDLCLDSDSYSDTDSEDDGTDSETDSSELSEEEEAHSRSRQALLECALTLIEHSFLPELIHGFLENMNVRDWIAHGEAYCAILGLLRYMGECGLGEIMRISLRRIERSCGVRKWLLGVGQVEWAEEKAVEHMKKVEEKKGTEAGRGQLKGGAEEEMKAVVMERQVLTNVPLGSVVRRLEAHRKPLLALSSKVQFPAMVEKVNALCDGISYLALQQVLCAT